MSSYKIEKYRKTFAKRCGDDITREEGASGEQSNGRETFLLWSYTMLLYVLVESYFLSLVLNFLVLKTQSVGLVCDLKI